MQFGSGPRDATIEAIVGSEVEAFELAIEPEVLAVQAKSDSAIAALIDYLAPGIARGKVPRTAQALRELAEPKSPQRVRVTVIADPSGNVTVKYTPLEPAPPGTKESPREFFRRIDKLLAAKLVENEDRSSRTESR